MRRRYHGAIMVSTQTTQNQQPPIVGLLVAMSQPHDPQPKRGIAQAYDLAVPWSPVV